jgi:hypothetical protein
MPTRMSRTSADQPMRTRTLVRAAHRTDCILSESGALRMKGLGKMVPRKVVAYRNDFNVLGSKWGHYLPLRLIGFFQSYSHLTQQKALSGPDHLRGLHQIGPHPLNQTVAGADDRRRWSSTVIMSKAEAVKDRSSHSSPWRRFLQTSRCVVLAQIGARIETSLDIEAALFEFGAAAF